MIQLRRDEPGRITIDLADEPTFDPARDGAVLATGLYVVESEAGYMVVDDNGQPGQVLSFIDRFLAGKRLKVKLDEALYRQLRSFREEQALVATIRRGDARRPAVPRDLGIQRDLLPHQRTALRHALAVRNAANFSVPGSGKTQSALAVYAALKRSGALDRLMVIGPASCFQPWEDEFAEAFGRRPNAARLIGTRSQRRARLRTLEGVDLVLCTYQMAYREREALAKTLVASRYFLVLDEAHHVKNIALGPWAKTVLDLAPLAERRMILTGTPAPHSVQDLWSQFTFLWPSQAVLGTRAQFEHKAARQGEDPIDAVKRDIAPFFIRTRKSDLGLPRPKTSFVRLPYRSIPRRQRLIIRLLELRAIQEAKDLGLSQPDVAVLRNWRRARTLRLMQAASNPALLCTALEGFGEFDAPLDGEPALATLLRGYADHEIPIKVAYAVREARRLVAAGQKVLIWATFVGNVRLLERMLADLRPLIVYGAVPPYAEDSDPTFESRERNIHDFKTLPTRDRPVLIANAAACSESVSLHTVCSNAIYLERTFNGGQFLQSLDRIHRVGMPKGVHPTYHIPLIPCAIEQVMDRRLRRRQQVLYDLLNDDMPVVSFGDDDSFLLGRDDDLPEIFAELLNEIGVRERKPNVRTPRRRRTSR